MQAVINGRLPNLFGLYQLYPFDLTLDSWQVGRDTMRFQLDLPHERAHQAGG